MLKSDFIRLALVLSDNQSATFKRGLCNIVKLVLFESQGTFISANEIATEAKTRYSLEFTDAEVVEAIKSDRKGAFIVSVDNRLTKYSLSPKESMKLQKIEDQPFIDDSVSRFMKTPFGQTCACSEKQLSNLIIKYMYEVFNNDIQTVLALMNYDGMVDMGHSRTDSFSNEEIEWINAFLNWEDKKKNKEVFELISACYEYCMITVKKDNRSFRSLLRGKRFFLDTNVIFRLTGLDTYERKTVIEAFVEKCVSCGVEVSYTNFTSKEIDDTIKYKVKRIKRLLSGRSPVSGSAMRQFHPDYEDIHFYEHYIQWIKQPGAIIGDYEGFAKHLRRLVYDSVSKMKNVHVESFNGRGKEKEFSEYCSDLLTYKRNRNRDVNKLTVKPDVENYLFLQQQSRRERSNSFLDKNVYFISADHAYIDWTREKNPGAIPSFVLPSVWYSIMLRFSGRATADDYTAFCLFLNRRKSIAPESRKNMRKRHAALHAVFSVDEPVDIKEEILFDVSDRLKSPKTEIESIPDIVKESRSMVLERRVDAIRVEHNREKEQMSEDFERIIEEKASTSFEEGKAVGRQENFEWFAHREAKRNRAIKVLGSALLILALIIIAVIAIVRFKSGKGEVWEFLKFFNDNQVVLAIISGTYILIAVLIGVIAKNTRFLTCDESRIVKRLQEESQRRSMLTK